MFKRSLRLIVIICFFLTSLGPMSQAHADILNLPAPGSMVNLSPAYQPVMIKGLTVHKDNPFLFDFIVDVGQDHLSGEPLKKEGEKLIKYFLASLAIPDKDVWVNLSPYEKNKMIPDALGQTDMGRDLLEQDYILKQITASLIYPEKQLGKEFWNKVYAKAQEQYGTTQIPVNTFNKVWIMADRAEVFEHNQTAFVVDSHLKVMLEEDYLALQKHNNKDMSSPNVLIGDPNTTHSISSQIIKQIILPELEHEVNTGKNFANLRQILNSLILANWYKNNLKQTLLNQVYTNKAKVKGIDLNDPTVKQQIYEQYLQAYKKGVFNYIKEDINSVSGQTMPRKYFSGGFGEDRAVIVPAVTTNAAMLNGLQDETLVSMTTGLNTNALPKTNLDAAMLNWPFKKINTNEATFSGGKILVKVNKDYDSTKPGMTKITVIFVKKGLIGKKLGSFDMKRPLNESPDETVRDVEKVLDDSHLKVNNLEDFRFHFPDIRKLLLQSLDMEQEPNKAMINGKGTFPSIEGDTWVSLAKKYYGDEKYAKFLAHANHQASENPISVGASIIIPELNLPPIREFGSATQNNAAMRAGQMWVDGKELDTNGVASQLDKTDLTVVDVVRSAFHLKEDGIEEHADTLLHQLDETLKTPTPISVTVETLKKIRPKIFSFIYALTDSSVNLPLEDILKQRSSEVIHISATASHSYYVFGRRFPVVMKLNPAMTTRRQLARPSQEAAKFNLPAQIKSLYDIFTVQDLVNFLNGWLKNLPPGIMIAAEGNKLVLFLMRGEKTAHSEVVVDLLGGKVVNFNDIATAISELPQNASAPAKNNSPAMTVDVKYDYPIWNVTIGKTEITSDDTGDLAAQLQEAMREELKNELNSLLRDNPNKDQIVDVSVDMVAERLAFSAEKQPYIVGVDPSNPQALESAIRKVLMDRWDKAQPELPFQTLPKKLAVLLQNVANNAMTNTESAKSPAVVTQKNPSRSIEEMEEAITKCTHYDGFREEGKDLWITVIDYHNVFLDIMTKLAIEHKNGVIVDSVPLKNGDNKIEIIDWKELGEAQQRRVLEILDKYASAAMTSPRVHLSWGDFKKAFDAGSKRFIVTTTRGEKYVLELSDVSREELSGENLLEKSKTVTISEGDFLKAEEYVGQEKEHYVVAHVTYESSRDLFDHLEEHPIWIAKAIKMFFFKTTEISESDSIEAAVKGANKRPLKMSMKGNEPYKFNIRGGVKLTFSDGRWVRISFVPGVNNLIVEGSSDLNLNPFMEWFMTKYKLQKPIIRETKSSKVNFLIDIKQSSKNNNPAMRGGIDLNTSNGMQWKVSKDGQGVEMNVDPAMIARIQREGIDSLSPVIFRITPVANVWSLVGLQVPAANKHLAAV